MSLPGYSATRCPAGTFPCEMATPLPPPVSRLSHTSRQNPNSSHSPSLPVSCSDFSLSWDPRTRLVSRAVTRGKVLSNRASSEVSCLTACFSRTLLSRPSLRLTWLEEQEHHAQWLLFEYLNLHLSGCLKSATCNGLQLFEYSSELNTNQPHQIYPVLMSTNVWYECGFYVCMWGGTGLMQSCV